MNQDNKRVDESWKASVQKEKSAEPAAEPAGSEAENSLLGLVSTLAMQALAALGEMPRPGTQEISQNLPQAQYLIDTLQLLSDKTKGNLTAEEDAEMKTILYELRVKYVKKNQEAV